MPARILMLEDNAMDVLLTVELLPEYEFVVVETLAGAMEALNGSQAFDCIVADMSVPDADGAAIITALRAMASDSAPVLAHSGSSDPELEAAVLAAGAYAMVRKDVGATGLKQALARAVGP
jgi:CheY-like chemotaxis protein